MQEEVATLSQEQITTLSQEQVATLSQEEQDLFYMQMAYIEAQLAHEMDEVPVGAVLVQDNRVIARAHNLREYAKMATHHAEMLAIMAGCQTLGGWRLPRTTLYITLEPCPMCAGAIINARIGRVVFASSDPKGGAMGSVCSLQDMPFNHKVAVKRGVLEEKCTALLRGYFRRKRAK